MRKREKLGRREEVAVICGYHCRQIPRWMASAPGAPRPPETSPWDPGQLPFPDYNLASHQRPREGRGTARSSLTDGGMPHIEGPDLFTKIPWELSTGDWQAKHWVRRSRPAPHMYAPRAGVQMQAYMPSSYLFVIHPANYSVKYVLSSDLDKFNFQATGKVRWGPFSMGFLTTQFSFHPQLCALPQRPPTHSYGAPQPTSPMPICTPPLLGHSLVQEGHKLCVHLLQERPRGSDLKPSGQGIWGSGYSEQSRRGDTLALQTTCSGK